MQKKIIILTPFYYPSVGGAETFASELHKIVDKYHMAITCTISWNKVWRGINWIDSISVVKRMFFKTIRYCKKYEPDTIHALGFNATFVAAILKPFFKFKLVVTPLALYNFNSNKFLKWITQQTLKHADIILAESETSRKNLSLVADFRKIKVFRHWVDTSKFFPLNREAGKRLKVLFVGRDIPEKGKHIIEYVESITPQVDFEYINNVPYGDLPKYYQEADILVVPSLYDESPNRVVAEGAACGCVVITSKVAALIEQVADFGFHVLPTPIDFKWLIDKIDKDRAWLKKLRHNTIEYAKEFLTERNTQVIINEY